MLWGAITFLAFWLPLKAIELLFKALFYVIGFALKLAVKVFLYIVALVKVLFDDLLLQSKM